MQKNLQIIFRTIPRSKAITEIINRKISKLERCHDKVTSCRVVLDTPHRKHLKGKQFQATINLSIPDKDFSVSTSHIDMHAAVREALATIQKQMTAHLARRRTNKAA